LSPPPSRDRASSQRRRISPRTARLFHH
jgi:hypothetical protein